MSVNQQREFLPAAGRDRFLPLYDPVVKLLGANRAREELIQQADLRPEQHILDLGCGTGTFVVHLKKNYPSLTVVGADPDAKALKRAQKKISRAGVSVQLDEAFADELPYRDKSFDRVVSSFMFHHLERPDREQTLREVLRVLKPGGSFHLLDFAAHGSHGLFDRLVDSHAELKENVDERILELMMRAGFLRPAKIKEGRMFFGLLRTAYYAGTK